MTEELGPMIDDLLRWQKRISELPERLAYVVIDHAHPADEAPFHGRDAKGKRYVIVSPSILDGMKYRKYDGISPRASQIMSPWAFGVPVIRRRDLPDDWPEGVGR